MSNRHTRAQTSLPPSLEAQVQRITLAGFVRPSRAAVLRAALAKGLPLVTADDLDAAERAEHRAIPTAAGSGVYLSAVAG